MPKTWMLLPLGLLPAGIIAASASALEEKISIRIRPAGDVCLGTCQDFELIVSSRGAVTTRDYWRGSNELTPKPHRQWRFRISASEYLRIKRALASVRPIGERRDIASCDKTGGAGSPDWRPDTRQYDIRWSGAGGTARRVGCDWQDGTGTAFGIVMKTLRLSPGSGRPPADRR